jgi:hypothetical protein
MRATGHEIVHEVVVARDGIENAAHAPLLFAPRYAFEPEISLCFSLGHDAREYIGGSSAEVP